MEKKRVLINVLVVALVVLLGIGAVAAVKLIPRQIRFADGALDELQDGMQAGEEHPKAFLVMLVAGEVKGPVALEEYGRYTITRGDHVNVVEVTEDSIRMAESTCDNQDCVRQGVVSLENRERRILQNTIVCLPNDVVLELYSYEEMMSMIGEDAGGQTE